MYASKTWVRLIKIFSQIKYKKIPRAHKSIKEVSMFRKKNGQEFMDELNVDSSVNDKEEKKGFFHKRKKKIRQKN